MGLSGKEQMALKKQERVLWALKKQDVWGYCLDVILGAQNLL